jgi:hypothetical protein
VRLTFELAGPSQAQGEELVDYYKGH